MDHQCIGESDGKDTTFQQTSHAGYGPLDPLMHMARKGFGYSEESVYAGYWEDLGYESQEGGLSQMRHAEARCC